MHKYREAYSKAASGGEEGPAVWIVKKQNIYNNNPPCVDLSYQNLFHFFLMRISA